MFKFKYYRKVMALTATAAITCLATTIWAEDTTADTSSNPTETTSTATNTPASSTSTSTPTTATTSSSSTSLPDNTTSSDTGFPSGGGTIPTATTGYSSVLSALNGIATTGSNIATHVSLIDKISAALYHPTLNTPLLQEALFKRNSDGTLGASILQETLYKFEDNQLTPILQDTLYWKGNKVGDKLQPIFQDALYGSYQDDSKPPKNLLASVFKDPVTDVSYLQQIAASTLSNLKIDNPEDQPTSDNNTDQNSPADNINPTNINDCKIDPAASLNPIKKTASLQCYFSFYNAINQNADVQAQTQKYLLAKYFNTTVAQQPNLGQDKVTDLLAIQPSALLETALLSTYLGGSDKLPVGSSVTITVPENINDLSYQALVDESFLYYPLTRDPRLQSAGSGKPSKVPTYLRATADNTIDSAFYYSQHASGINITRPAPEPGWAVTMTEYSKEGKKTAKKQYVDYFNTVSAIQSFDHYVMSQMYLENTQLDSEKKRVTNTQKLIQQATDANWFTIVGTESIGLVLRHMLMYLSQMYVVMTQQLQVQKQLLTAQTMNNTLMILSLSNQEKALYDSATNSQ